MLYLRQVFGSGKATKCQIIEGASGTNGDAAVSGEPVITKGNIPGTCVEAASSGVASVLIEPHICEFVVTGNKSGGNAAIAAGDLIYMKSDGSLDGDTGGTKFGMAYGNSLEGSGNKLGTDTLTGTLVSSGASTRIRVLVLGIGAI
jgi:hypothetical protein